PLGAWVKAKAAPDLSQLLPPVSAVPWRPAGSAPTLSTASFEVVTYLEQLIDEDASGEAFALRWRDIRKDPTKFFHSYSGEAAPAWRAGRKGVLAGVAFGVFEPDSDNYAFVTLAPDGSPAEAISRQKYYEISSPLLVSAHNSAPPSDA